MVTASEDSNVWIVKTSTWRLEKTLVKHKGGVVDVSIHPSGKMALSIGKDKKLVTWNLVCMELSRLARILQARGASNSLFKHTKDHTYTYCRFRM